MTTAVAIALYNGEKFIEKQLDTIRLQTVKVDRVVLCDDGSSDNTFGLVEDYISKFELGDSWKIYKNEKNLGYARNFYHAMELCDCDLIYLCDQDDIWELEKLEKMNKIMVENPNINLLSCKHGVIDAQDNEMNSVLERKCNDTEEIQLISVDNIMHSYHWPGMGMCIRNDFFKEILPIIQDLKLAHDMVFALISADRDSFFEYDYIGVHHRRHDNNAANEESRISKLLNLKRKLRDVKVYNDLLSGVLSAGLPLSEFTQNKIKSKLDFSLLREESLKERSLLKMIKAYKGLNKDTFRIATLLCDIWIICFGNCKN